MPEFIAGTCLAPSSALHGNFSQVESDFLVCSLKYRLDPLKALKLFLVTETFRIIFMEFLQERLLFVALRRELIISFH